MARIDRNKEILAQVLANRAETYQDSEVETQLWLDHENGHYQILHVGWKEPYHRVYSVVLHADIKDGKIWIQQDNTDMPLALELLQYGVTRDEIVLAFHAPYKRPYTEYAVA